MTQQLPCVPHGTSLLWLCHAAASARGLACIIPLITQVLSLTHILTIEVQ